jgi:hypothetical protein
VLTAADFIAPLKTGQLATSAGPSYSWTMAYQYEFDSTRAGNFRINRTYYRILHDALVLLRDELSGWNERAVKNGAKTPPYEREVEHITNMIQFGNAELSKNTPDIVVAGITVGSLRYFKAALALARKREQDHSEKERKGWPSAVLSSIAETIQQFDKISKLIEQEPADVFWEVMPKEESAVYGKGAQAIEWDVFISHATEDKEDFARPLAERLRSQGLRVWFDEFTLTLGDSLRRSIDRGLARSRYGVVVISPNFLRKKWPQMELDGLVAREINEVKSILPVWHNISAEEVHQYLPTLADRLAVSSDKGLDFVVEEIIRAIRREEGNDS